MRLVWIEEFAFAQGLGIYGLLRFLVARLDEIKLRLC
jgi:hypothetical protein